MALSFKVDEKARSLVLNERLIEAQLIERPNRYVAEVALFSDGTVQRAHVPVGGRIGGLTLDGLPCLISGPYEGRSTDYTVEAIGSHFDKDDFDFQWIGINQTASNRYVAAFLKAGVLPKLTRDLPPRSLKSERELGAKRIDFSMGMGDPTELWIEVKTPLIELSTEFDSKLPVKTDFAPGAPSARMPEQFEALAEELKRGSRVVFLGVYGYSTMGKVSSRDRYRANLNLDGLVDRGLELGMDFAELELIVTPESITVGAYRELFSGSKSTG